MGVIVTINDLRAATMCARAARPWFEAHELSWGAFVHMGIDADILRDTKDALALKVIAIAEARVAKEKASSDGQ